MNSRERVLAAIGHREPDRVPLFKPNVISTYEEFDPRVRDFFDSFEFDRFADVGAVRSHPAARREAGKEAYEDAYGCRYRYRGVGMPYCVHHPLAGAESVEEVEQFEWPNPDPAGLLAPQTREEALWTRREGRHLTRVHLGNIFHQYHYLRGFERWMMDLKLRPELHRRVAEHILDIRAMYFGLVTAICCRHRSSWSGSTLWPMS